MEKLEAKKQIELIREKIDEIDAELVKLLCARANLSLQIRKLKPDAEMELFDAQREGAIYEKVCNMSTGELYDAGLKEIYATMLKVMKENPDNELH